MRANPTPAEKKMKEILESQITAKFPQHEFDSQVQKAGYILDFYCPTLNLAIEVDGSSHDGKKGYDWERDSHLANWGIQVYRANNSDVFNYPEDLAQSLCKIIEEKETKPQWHETPRRTYRKIATVTHQEDID